MKLNLHTTYTTLSEDAWLPIEQPDEDGWFQARWCQPVGERRVTDTIARLHVSDLKLYWKHED